MVPFKGSLCLRLQPESPGRDAEASVQFIPSLLKQANCA